ncbi:MAG: hypothetical protein HZB25_04950 [Candidatus Eisenbacteria bacterium]|nr:hypothetical protein [Candidatus Eisenbacteria bacterium]
MKKLHLLLTLVLVSAAAGCILVSAQIFTTMGLADIHVTGATGMDPEFVDLNTEPDYVDHKDELKTLADFALMGDFTNVGTGDLGVEVWITADSTNYGTATEVRAGATRLWGPFNVAGGATQHITWDASAALIDKAGKAVLINEAKGDGKFTLYALGATGDYEFRILNVKMLLTLDVGK